MGNIFIPEKLCTNIKSRTNYNFENLICTIDHKGKQCQRNGGCDGVVVYLNIEIAKRFNQAKNGGKEFSKILNSGLVDKDTNQAIYLIIDTMEKADEEKELNQDQRIKVAINHQIQKKWSENRSNQVTRIL